MFLFFELKRYYFLPRNKAGLEVCDAKLGKEAVYLGDVIVIGRI